MRVAALVALVLLVPGLEGSVGLPQATVAGELAARETIHSRANVFLVN